MNSWSMAATAPLRALSIEIAPLTAIAGAAQESKSPGQPPTYQVAGDESRGGNSRCFRCKPWLVETWRWKPQPTELGVYQLLVDEPTNQ